MRKYVRWIAVLAAAAFTASAATGQQARDLYLSYGVETQSQEWRGRPGVKLSIELVRDDKTLMVPPEHAFRSGDRIRLHFETNFDGHVGILGKGSSGRVSQLFPYPGASSVIRRGDVKLMPANGDWLVFDHRPGEELLAVILSHKPITGLTSTSVDAPPAANAGSTGGTASAEEEEEILAALNSRSLAAGRDLFLEQSWGDSGYAVTAQEVRLEKPVGLLVKLTHKGIEP